METITQIENDVPMLQKPTVISSHTYKTGARYDGEWKGGMRHG